MKKSLLGLLFLFSIPVIAGITISPPGDGGGGAPGPGDQTSYLYAASAALISSPPAIGTSLMQVIGDSKEAVVAATQAATAGTPLEFTITVNIVSQAGTGATETLEITTNPSNGDSFSLNDPFVGSEVFTFVTSASQGFEITIGSTANDTADNTRTVIGNDSALATSAGSNPDVDFTLNTVGSIGGGFIDANLAATTTVQNTVDGTDGTTYNIGDNEVGVNSMSAGPEWTPGGTTSLDCVAIMASITNNIPNYTGGSCAANIGTVTRDSPGNAFSVGFAVFTNDIPTGHSDIALTVQGGNPQDEGFRDTYLGQFLGLSGTDAIVTNSYIEVIECDGAIGANATLSPKTAIRFGGSVFDGQGSDKQTHVLLAPCTGAGAKAEAQRVEIIGT